MRFWFHFNKPATAKAGKPQITVHIKKACHVVDNVICRVPTEGRLRKQQPKFVMAGDCSAFKIRNNVMELS